MGIFSLIFGENNHQIIKFLQKKNIFKNIMQKKNVQTIILHVLQLLKKKDKKSKTKKEKKNNNKRLCL